MTQVGLGTYQKAIAQSGKPINVGDTIVWLGVVSTITGVGPDAVIVATGIESDNTVDGLLAEDIGSSTQTL